MYFSVPEESLYQAKPTKAEEEENLPPDIFVTMGAAEEASGEPSTSQTSTTSDKRFSWSWWHPKVKLVHPGISKGGVKRVRIIEACPLNEATQIFPTKSDQQEGYLHVGVKKELRSPRLSSKYVKDVGYMCNFVQAMIDAGTGAGFSPCNDISSNMGQLSTHIRQTHLGAALQCYVCGYRAWSGKTWKDHMKEKHTDLGEDNFFIADEADVGKFIIEHEVEPKDTWTVVFHLDFSSINLSLSLFWMFLFKGTV